MLSTNLVSSQKTSGARCCHFCCCFTFFFTVFYLSFLFLNAFGREEGCWGQLSCENFVLNTNPQIKEVLIFLHFPVVVVWLRSQFFVHQACYFVSFKPRKASQFKKDVFSSCRERGTKKNSESPWGSELIYVW